MFFPYPNFPAVAPLCINTTQLRSVLFQTSHLTRPRLSGTSHWPQALPPKQSNRPAASTTQVCCTPAARDAGLAPPLASGHGPTKAEPTQRWSRLPDMCLAKAFLLMREILDVMVYQNSRGYGSIVYIGVKPDFPYHQQYGTRAHLPDVGLPSQERRGSSLTKVCLHLNYRNHVFCRSLIISGLHDFYRSLIVSI